MSSQPGMGVPSVTVLDFLDRYASLLEEIGESTEAKAVHGEARAIRTDLGNAREER